MATRGMIKLLFFSDTDGQSVFFFFIYHQIYYIKYNNNANENVFGLSRIVLRSVVYNKGVSGRIGEEGGSDIPYFYRPLSFEYIYF
jgi:hypothetical protein